MFGPSHVGKGRLLTFLLLIISFLDFAFAVPLARNIDGETSSQLARRAIGPDAGKEQITEADYIEYLLKYYPPDQYDYIEYTGDSWEQVVNYKKQNPKAMHYEDFFNAYKSEHYFTAFPESLDRMDDGEASSRAISGVAKTLKVFGAIEYKKFPTSFYTSDEAKINKEGVRDGRISKGIQHMQKGATKPDQVMAIEDGNGDFTYMPGFKEGDTNADSERRTSSSSSKRPRPPTGPRSPGGSKQTSPSNSRDGSKSPSNCKRDGACGVPHPPKPPHGPGKAPEGPGNVTTGPKGAPHSPGGGVKTPPITGPRGGHI